MRLAPGVGGAGEAVTDADEGAGMKGAEVEGRHVEEGGGRLVGGQEDLESAVQREAVDDVRAHPPARAVVGFEDADRVAELTEAHGGR